MVNNQFFRCYLYDTPEGRKPIGVTRGLGDIDRTSVPKARGE